MKKRKKSPINIAVISEEVTGSPNKIRHDSTKFRDTIAEAEETVIGIFKKTVLTKAQKKQAKRMGL